MQIDHTQHASGGRYSTVVEGHEAFLSYSRASAKLIIVDHTQVPDELRGRGIGQALAIHAVEEARKGGWKINPLCPFFRSQALRHPDWRDVVT